MAGHEVGWFQGAVGCCRSRKVEDSDTSFAARMGSAIISVPAVVISTIVGGLCARVRHSEAQKWREMGFGETEPSAISVVPSKLTAGVGILNASYGVDELGVRNTRAVRMSKEAPPPEDWA